MSELKLRPPKQKGFLQGLKPVLLCVRTWRLKPPPPKEQGKAPATVRGRYMASSVFGPKGFQDLAAWCFFARLKNFSGVHDDLKFAKKVRILWCQRFMPKRFLFLKSPLGRFGNFQVVGAARSKEPHSDCASGLECVCKLHKLPASAGILPTQ